MIPKIIHYIWVGGKPLPKIAEKCIKSWQKYCPDYEIKRWDESNLDLNFCDYVKEAYEAKKFAFVSDVLRTKILYDEGGIYLDIDVELYKTLDTLLQCDCFYGFESEKAIAPGLIFGSVAKNPDLKSILEGYKQRHFMIDGKMDLKTICETFTEYYENKGLIRENKNQVIDKTYFYATEYFCPKDYQTGKITKTKNTIAIHHYYSSWQTPLMKFKQKCIQLVKRILGEKNVKRIQEKRRLKREKNEKVDNIYTNI